MPRKFTFRGTDPFSGESYTFEREFPREMTFEEAQRWAEKNVDWDSYYGPPHVERPAAKANPRSGVRLGKRFKSRLRNQVCPYSFEPMDGKTICRPLEPRGPYGLASALEEMSPEEIKQALAQNEASALRKRYRVLRADTIREIKMKTRDRSPIERKDEQSFDAAVEKALGDLPRTPENFVLAAEQLLRHFQFKTDFDPNTSRRG